MKKALLGILIIFAIGAISAPYVNGLILENILRSQVDKYNELYAEQSFYPNIEITNYDRNFGSSEIEWTITLPYLPSLDQVDPIILVEKAKHGVFGLTSTTDLHRNSGYIDFIRDHLGGNDPLTISSCYGILNGLTTTISFEQFQLNDDKGNDLIVNPGELVINADRAFENIRTDSNFEGFSVPGEIDIKGIVLQSNIKLISSFIVDGTTSVSVEQFNIEDVDADIAFAVSSFKAETGVDFDEAAKKLSMSARYSVGEIVSDGEKVADVRIRFGINNLDSEGFEAVYGVYAELMSDLLANIATAQNDAEQVKKIMERQMAVAGIRFVTEAEKLLKKDLQIEISDLHLILPQGEVDGDFAIGLKKDMTLASFVALAQQPEKLVEIFSFTSNMTLPVGLIPDQDKLLTPILPGMQTGIFEKNGGNLVHSAEIKEDILFLNGKDFFLR